MCITFTIVLWERVSEYGREGSGKKEEPDAAASVKVTITSEQSKRIETESKENSELQPNSQRKQKVEEYTTESSSSSSPTTSVAKTRQTIISIIMVLCILQVL